MTEEQVKGISDAICVKVMGDGFAGKLVNAVERAAVGFVVTGTASRMKLEITFERGAAYVPGAVLGVEAHVDFKVDFKDKEKERNPGDGN